ncbi:MAG: hypothetical protein IKJ46_04190 [Tidjanibacter sp.]|nr:hypothetical protein [Tidjanibacter sp.]
MNKRKHIFIAAVVAMMVVGCSEPEPVYVTKPNPYNEEAKLEFLSENTSTVNAEKQEVCFDFKSNMDCFDIKVDRDWCSAKVVDNNKVVVEVEKNQYNNNRMATITIVAGIYDNITAPQTLTVYQGRGEIDLPKVGDLYGTGVVYWVSSAAADAGFRVVSLKRAYGMPAQWSMVTQFMGMKDTKFGSKNVEKIDNLDNFPAFNYCATMAENHGQGWYLPAVNEWSDILVLYNGGLTPTKGLPTAAEMAKRTEFESFLAANGGDPFNAFVYSSNGDSYWTSTEIDDVEAYYIGVYKNNTTGGNKTSVKRGVRCIQHFDLR